MIWDVSYSLLAGQIALEQYKVIRSKGQTKEKLRKTKQTMFVKKSQNKKSDKTQNKRKHPKIIEKTFSHRFPFKLDPFLIGSKFKWNQFKLEPV